MTFTMILTVRTLMGGSAETSLTEYLLLTATTTLLSIFAGVFQTGITLFYLNTACGRPAVTANLFYGFKYLFKKSLGISAVLILLNTACTLRGNPTVNSKPGINQGITEYRYTYR